MDNQDEFPLASEIFDHMKILQSHVNETGDWPKGVVKFEYPQLKGVGFFPAAKGVYGIDREPLRDIPVGGVLALGHDWGTVQDYKDCLNRDAENIGGNATWRNMKQFYDRINIDLRTVYFTNFFIGLREGPSSTGEFPGNKFPPAKNNDKYIAACQELVLKQIIAQRPKLLIVYGAYLPKLMAPLAVKLNGWSQFNGFKGLDKGGNQLIDDVVFEYGGTSHTSTVVSLVHPCYRQRTAQYRSWKNIQGVQFTGDEAEQAMVHQAMGKR